MQMDQVRDAAAVAAALRDTLRDALAPDFHVTGGTYAVYVREKAADGADEPGPMIADITVQGSSRSYAPIVKVQIRGPYELRGTKTVGFWAGEDKHYAIDPAKILARVYTLAQTARAFRANEITRRDEIIQREKRKAAAAEPIRAYIEQHFQPRYPVQMLEVAEGKHADGYAYAFTLRLTGLTQAQALAVLALLPGKGDQ